MKGPTRPTFPPDLPEIEALYREVQAAGPRRPRGLALLPPVHLLREVPRRRRFMERYGWAVPTPAAVSAIADFVGSDRLLELGAGAGLWARLLAAVGLSITATDDFSWGAGRGDRTSLPSGFAVEFGRFFPVEKLDAAAAVKRYADCSCLLLIWPPPDRDMALVALAAFAGNKLVFVGDPHASGNEQFHKELDARWPLQERLALPNWPGVHDAVYLYERPRSDWAVRAERRPNPHLVSKDF